MASCNFQQFEFHTWASRMKIRTQRSPELPVGQSEPFKIIVLPIFDGPNFTFNSWFHAKIEIRTTPDQSYCCQLNCNQSKFWSNANYGQTMILSGLDFLCYPHVNLWAWYKGSQALEMNGIFRDCIFLIKISDGWLNFYEKKNPTFNLHRRILTFFLISIPIS